MKKAGSDDLDTYLRQRIVHFYLSHLFHYTADNPSPRIDLWDFILSNRPEQEKPECIFHVFLPLLESAQKALAIYRAMQDTQKATMRDWLVENHNRDQNAVEITATVDKMLDLGHVAYAARFLRGCQLQVLWVDNIDALPEALQSIAVQHLREFQLLVGAYVSCLVSVREENVFRLEDVPEGDMPVGERRVLLEIPRGLSAHADYPAIDMPVASLEAISRIVRKRMDYTRTHLRTVVPSAASGEGGHHQQRTIPESAQPKREAP